LSYVPSLKKRKDARLDNLLRPLELAA